MNNNYEMNCNYNEKKVPEIENLDDLVKNLRQIFDESDDIDVDYVQNLFLSYKSNPNDWCKYAHWDQHKLTRNLVDKGNGKYNLMLVCWSQYQGSSIHDHSDSHCFMKILSGSLTETLYEWPDTNKPSEEQNSNEMNETNETLEMKVLDEKILKTNGITYINDSLGLHRVENKSHTNSAVSLHLYIPPYSKCQAFDPRTGHRNQVNITFYSKYGQRSPYRLAKPAQMSDPNENLINGSDNQLIERQE